ncbi:2'-5' RNA ligase family protein [Streptomyces sp. NBC_01471]|uniref:2'-5' RNA ligase family protein n=1 Tax=Streptomyces sp. NBC_01471 TaxID=2903879 RepID=UPI00324BB7E0
MENFFVPKKIWKDGGPFPHVLILLSEYPEFREYARAHHELLAEYGEKLGVIPQEWLHSTVQGVHHAIDEDQRDMLRVAVREELAGMNPFQVQLGPVWPGVTAVTVAVYPEDGMAELNGRARMAMERVPGITLRAPELRFWAHSTLAYARRNFPGRKLNRALRALRPPRVDITISRVHLVTQYQHPDLGYYTWKVVEEFQLGQVPAVLSDPV